MYFKSILGKKLSQAMKENDRYYAKYSSRQLKKKKVVYYMKREKMYEAF